MDKHIGFPLPSEMFAPEKEKEDFDKHAAISELLDIPLKCPHCKEILKQKWKNNLNVPLHLNVLKKPES